MMNNGLCQASRPISPAGHGLLYLIFVIIVCSTKCFAELQKFEHPPKGDGSLSFLVIGDWGRKGSENQSEVATQQKGDRRSPRVKVSEVSDGVVLLLTSEYPIGEQQQNLLNTHYHHHHDGLPGFTKMVFQDEDISEIDDDEDRSPPDSAGISPTLPEFQRAAAIMLSSSTSPIRLLCRCSTSTMGKVAKKLDIDFVISTGDNFYDDGLKGVTDPNFEESFSRIYTANSLQKPWYSVLGNHDYRGDVRAQLSPILRKMDDRWICKRSFVLHSEIADFFFLDTTPLVDMYFDPFEDHIYDWRGVLPRHNYISNLLKNFESSLKESTAKWKIVVGHHAIRSVGHHGNTQELIRHVLPILQANNADFYMNGHDHCLEHLSTQDSSIQFFTSGAGSRAWRGDVKGRAGNGGIEFFYDGPGFMSVQLNQSDAQIVFYDVSGDILHQWKISKAHLHSAI